MRESKRSKYVRVVKPVTRGLTLRRTRGGGADATPHPPRRYKYVSGEGVVCNGEHLRGD